MTAREYFESASSAVRRADGRAAVLRAMREREGARAALLGAIPGGRGATDPMRLVDARMDAEAEAERELKGLKRAIGDARKVCKGVSAANPSHPAWGAVLEMHFIELLSWRDAGRYLGMSGEAARRAAYAALEWVDSVGLAAAREGSGMAEPR